MCADCNVEKDVIFALSLYEDDAVYEVALVTNHRYKKFARTGHPSGPTKFSFFFVVRCGRGGGRPTRVELKPTRTKRVRSARRLQLGEEARLTDKKSFDAYFLSNRWADDIVIA